MTGSQLPVVVQLASRVNGPPYDPEGAQELCDLLERLLQGELDADRTWSKWDWLDGFIPQWLERQSNVVFIRGGIWVNAVRPEPCEIEVHLVEPEAVTIRFMDADGPSTVAEFGRITFPRDRQWLYVFNLSDRGSALPLANMDEAIETALAVLTKLSARYAPDVAPRIEEPASATEIAEFQSAAGEEIPASVLALLRRTRAVVAMAIHNGYWIGGPAELARSMLRDHFPRELDAHGQSTRAIPIATDGGGNAFMVALGIGSVWRWDHETGVIRCVAHDLPEFLHRVAEDWAHDLDGDGTWNYLV